MDTKPGTMKAALFNKIYEHIATIGNRREEIDRLWELNNAKERDIVLDLIIEDNKDTLDLAEIKKWRDQGLHSLIWTIIIGTAWDNLHCEYP